MDSRMCGHSLFKTRQFLLKMEGKSLQVLLNCNLLQIDRYKIKTSDSSLV